MGTCYHCGDSCNDHTLQLDDKSFCCNGCKTVYEILHENNLDYYYELEGSPGTTPSASEHRFDYLDNQEIVDKLLEFDEGNTQIVSFIIPSIHCSSCIWVLENLGKLDKSVKSSQVNFPEKSIRIVFNGEERSLKDLVLLLNRIGYEPHIALENTEKKKRPANRMLIYKLGVAGFAFGNIMFLSFPEYFEVNEFWLDKFKYVFRWLIFAFSIPVVLFSASDYFVAAYKGLRSRILNIDVPIALGIAVLFIRSTVDIVMDWGTGFFDSLTGLVFFLLIGKYFQQQTYRYLSFERDYKSYFPLAVTKLEVNSEGKRNETQVEVQQLKEGDRLVIRNNELLPVDTTLLKGNGLIDYSFVSGESNPVSRNLGDTLYAGGKQMAGAIEVEVIRAIDQSYLTKLWQNEIFGKKTSSVFHSLTDSISKRFTIVVLLIAFMSGIFWLIYDPGMAFNVFTAVLIVACPCAIALAAPFTLGNLIRILGQKKCYLKKAEVIEKLAKVDTIVFDKTGTLSKHNTHLIRYHGIALTPSETELLTSTLRASNHPLSRSLYALLKENNIRTLDEFEEIVGVGMHASSNETHIKVGSYQFVADTDSSHTSNRDPEKTVVHISSNDEYKGCYVFENEYRNGVSYVFEKLRDDYDMLVLSGDNDGERQNLQRLLPKGTRMFFKQSPESKMEFVEQLQKEGKKVMMIGDGLNDAGALKQSDVGIAISENTNVFSPACDGILDAAIFDKLPQILKLSKSGIKIIQWSFAFSLMYNLIGLGFAVSGHLAPVVAAILMPLSSISIVIFTTMASRFTANKVFKTIN